jgi:hypothetical protein
VKATFTASYAVKVAFTERCSSYLRESSSEVHAVGETGTWPAPRSLVSRTATATALTATSTQFDALPEE